MRLTDLPKTLAEMRPDIEWPAELQAVMDKVLARDADERYQKSADFGRDIAKAVENMPAAVAAAAGTMVIGAAAADVPKTRMAAKGGATAKMETPSVPTPVVPAPTKKSPVMMIVAAVVVIGAIGGGVMFMNKGGGSAAAPPRSDAPAPGAPANAAAPVASSDPSKSAPPAGDTKKADAKATVTPMGKPVTSVPTNTASAPAANSAAVIARWQKVFEDTDHPPTETDGKQAIAEINPLIEKLSGADRSNALYVQMLAYGAEDSDVLFCRAYAEVTKSDGNSNHLKTAALMSQGRGCK